MDGNPLFIYPFGIKKNSCSHLHLLAPTIMSFYFKIHKLIMIYMGLTKMKNTENAATLPIANHSMEWLMNYAQGLFNQIKISMRK